MLDLAIGQREQSTEQDQQISFLQMLQSWNPVLYCFVFQTDFLRGINFVFVIPQQTKQVQSNPCRLERILANIGIDWLASVFSCSAAIQYDNVSLPWTYPTGVSQPTAELSGTGLRGQLIRILFCKSFQKSCQYSS